MTLDVPSLAQLATLAILVLMAAPVTSAPHKPSGAVYTTLGPTQIAQSCPRGYRPCAPGCCPA